MSLTFAVLLGLGTLALALNAGFFFAYSVSVMRGLDAVDPRAAIEVMNGINRTIQTPPFAVVFFGPLVLPVLTIVSGQLARAPGVALALIGGALLIYGLGVFLVTLRYNLPLNAGLAQLVPGSALDAQADWQAFLRPWLVWNHVRIGSSLLSFALTAAALVLAFRR